VAGTEVRLLARHLPVGTERILQVSQVHGADVVRAEEIASATTPLEADAIVARHPLTTGPAPTVIGIRVADCVPILLADPESGTVAAIHAGWRGVVRGVLRQAVQRFTEEGGMPARAVAAIGPCIGPCCFEVDDEVGRTIEASCTFDGGAPVETIVARRSGTKAYVDLRAAVRLQLRTLGIATTRTDTVAPCTSCDATRFFSYRRDHGIAGRLLAFIAPLPPRSASPGGS
jgi:YfiH family protein